MRKKIEAIPPMAQTFAINSVAILDALYSEQHCSLIESAKPMAYCVDYQDD